MNSVQDGLPLDKPAQSSSPSSSPPACCTEAYQPPAKTQTPQMLKATQDKAEDKAFKLGIKACVAAGAAGVLAAIAGYSVSLVGGFAAVTLLSGPVGWAIGAAICLIIAAILIYKQQQALKEAGLETDTLQTIGIAAACFVFSVLIAGLCIAACCLGCGGGGGGGGGGSSSPPSGGGSSSSNFVDVGVMGNLSPSIHPGDSTPNNAVPPSKKELSDQELIAKQQQQYQQQHALQQQPPSQHAATPYYPQTQYGQPQYNAYQHPSQPQYAPPPYYPQTPYMQPQYNAYPQGQQPTAVPVYYVTPAHLAAIQQQQAAYQHAVYQQQAAQAAYTYQQSLPPQYTQ